MRKQMAHQGRATCLGVGAFLVFLSALYFFTHDLIFSAVIGFVFGIGMFDLTLILSNPDS